jgi:hypothetical protein
MANGQGIVTFNFGAAPGTNIVTSTVSAPTISSTSKVELYFMGTDSTATHNMYEHAILGLSVALSCISITAGSGFTAQAASMEGHSGTIQARYVWTD